MNSIEPDMGDIVRLGVDGATAASAPRASVAIGFGSPSGDTGVTRLDLNDILVRHPLASFLMRAAGEAMQQAGVGAGDLLLIDRAITPADGHTVVAVVGDDFICRRLTRQAGSLRLQATQPGVADIVAREGDELQVWGVVTHVIKTLVR